MSDQQWTLLPVDDPTKGDRSWVSTNDVEVECPRCGEIDLVPVTVYATTDGSGKLSMYGAAAAPAVHNCDESLDLELDHEVDLDEYSGVVDLDGRELTVLEISSWA